MFVVVTPFADKYDNQRIYKAGDIFPREGMSVGDGRVSELLLGRGGIPFIREASGKPEEALEKSTQADIPGDTAETEKKPRKGRKKHVGTDSALHT